MIAETLLTHPDKVFWPADGYTKRDLARFYERVFPKLQPYVQDRMLSLERSPDGMRGERFFQKEEPWGLPAGTRTKAIRHQEHIVHYVVGGLIETEIALVNLGCIPVHVWGSCASHPHQPDWVVFDIDPGSGEFADAARTGLLLKDALEALDMVSFPKTSGGRGMHVFLTDSSGPGFRRGTVLRRGTRQAVGSGPSGHDNRRATPGGSTRPGVPGRYAERIWRNRGSALFGTPPREGAVLNAASVAGSETVARSGVFQSGQFREASGETRSLAGFLQAASALRGGVEGFAHELTF
jgi:DNA ligase D-like protein (predicted polymerase)